MNSIEYITIWLWCKWKITETAAYRSKHKIRVKQLSQVLFNLIFFLFFSSFTRNGNLFWKCDDVVSLGKSGSTLYGKWNFTESVAGWHAFMKYFEFERKYINHSHLKIVTLKKQNSMNWVIVHRWLQGVNNNQIAFFVCYQRIVYRFVYRIHEYYENGNGWWWWW